MIRTFIRPAQRPGSPPGQHSSGQRSRTSAQNLPDRSFQAILRACNRRILAQAGGFIIYGLNPPSGISFAEKITETNFVILKAAKKRFVRAGLRNADELLIVYTGAVHYYPLETDLKTVLDAYSASDHHLLLTALRDVLTGESGPYQSVPLLSAESDGTRLRALSAFASPRHERLLHLTAAREYDAVQVITDVAETSRARVGGIAARVALEDTPGGGSLHQRMRVISLNWSGFYFVSTKGGSCAGGSTTKSG